MPADAWTTIEVCDEEKGPLRLDVVTRRVQARTPIGGTGPEEILFVTREAQLDGKFKHDYSFSTASTNVDLNELACVAKAAHRVEECFQRAKSEAGLGDYQVRRFLEEETRRGKNPDPRADLSATAPTDRERDRATAQAQRSFGSKPPQYTIRTFSAFVVLSR
ncbi:MAG: hypothetical protein ABI353_02540 [Isosphaeraceae bacterium]